MNLSTAVRDQSSPRTTGTGGGEIRCTLHNSSADAAMRTGAATTQATTVIASFMLDELSVSSLRMGDSGCML